MAQFGIRNRRSDCNIKYLIVRRVFSWVDLFIFREGKEGRKRERNIDVRVESVALSHTPDRVPGPQPRQVHWRGIEPVTFWFTGQHSIHWVTPARAIVKRFLRSLIGVQIESSNSCLGSFCHSVLKHVFSNNVLEWWRFWVYVSTAIYKSSHTAWTYIAFHHVVYESFNFKLCSIWTMAKCKEVRETFGISILYTSYWK